MNKFNLTLSKGVELLGGMLSPIGSIIEVKINGIQFAQNGLDEVIGFQSCVFVDQVQADNKNPLMIKRAESNSPTVEGGEIIIGGIVKTSDFTFVTGVDGQLTSESIDSLTVALKPIFVAELIGIVEADIS